MSRREVGQRRPRDPGLQAERTALAWSRTGLAMLVNALLALRSGWTVRDAPITALGFVLLAASGVTIVYGAWRRRTLLVEYEVFAPSAHAVTAVVAVTLLACAVGVASVLVGGGSDSAPPRSSYPGATGLQMR